MYVLNADLILIAAQAPSGGSQPSSSPLFFVMIAIMVLLFWMMIVKPQRRQEKERKQMLSTLEKGDMVITIGGIHGSVVEIDEKGEKVTLEVAKNVRMDFLRSAISQIKKK